MSKRVGLEIAVAAAHAVALCRPDVVSAYPITPSSHVAEVLAELVADGKLDCEYLPMESEHSALSGCVGASATGARTFTVTASQGLLYMGEIVPIVPAMRLPVVMILANRAISGPINIWNDQSDVMAVRDFGWISMFAQNGQETVDMIIQAYKIAEHEDVQLPVFVNLDGFVLTHMVEPILMPEQEEVDKFLPPRKPFATLHPDKIVTMGPVGMPEIYTESKKAQDEALINSKKVILEVWKEWEKTFGRKYEPIESYKMKDAEVAVMTCGAIGETAEVAVDQLRKEGIKAGLLRLKLFRPFPVEELKKAVKGLKAFAVIDRASSPGGPGAPLGMEVKAALFEEPVKPIIMNEILGLGGRDVRLDDFIKIYKKALNADKVKPERAYEFFEVRGGS